MRRRERVAWLTRWCGLTLSLIIVGAWVFSGACILVYQKAISKANSSGYSHCVQFGLSAGCIVSILNVAGTGDFPYFYRRPKWIVMWTPCFLREKWRADLGQGSYYILRLPLWMPFLLVSTATVFLWWRDRRRIPHGHCQRCGYNFTGITSDVCPECGTPVPSATDAASDGVGDVVPPPVERTRPSL